MVCIRNGKSVEINAIRSVWTFNFLFNVLAILRNRQAIRTRREFRIGSIKRFCSSTRTEKVLARRKALVRCQPRVEVLQICAEGRDLAWSHE